VFAAGIARRLRNEGLGPKLLALFFLAITLPEQSSSVWAQENASACDAALSVTHDRGLERIKIVSPCRHGETVRASYGTWEQQAAFRDDGTATLAVALTDKPRPIILTFRDGTQKEIQTDASSMAPVLRITLQWYAPVDFNLHVVEPMGVPGGKGDAVAGHAPEQFGLRGRLDLEDDGSGLSPFQESYVFPDRSNWPSDIFTAYLENVTRGKTPSGEYCGKGQYAALEVDVIVANRGKVTKSHISLRPALCGAPLDQREYYLKLPL
jgi:hypothetical protein